MRAQKQKVKAQVTLASDIIEVEVTVRVLQTRTTANHVRICLPRLKSSLSLSKFHNNLPQMSSYFMLRRSSTLPLLSMMSRSDLSTPRRVTLSCTTWTRMVKKFKLLTRMTWSGWYVRYGSSDGVHSWTRGDGPLCGGNRRWRNR